MKYWLKGRRMFDPNGLQRALFIDVVNSSWPGSGTRIAAESSEAIVNWLRRERRNIVQLTRIMSVVVSDNKESDFAAIIIDMVHGLDCASQEILAWFDMPCLNRLIGPEAIESIGEDRDELLRRLAQLVSLRDNL